MQIVIDISDEEYKRWREAGEIDALIVRNSLVNGTPLPKGHGDLKDVSRFHYVTMLSQNPNTGKHKHITVVRAKEINDAPTIIKADKSEVEK